MGFQHLLSFKIVTLSLNLSLMSCRFQPHCPISLHRNWMKEEPWHAEPCWGNHLDILAMNHLWKDSQCIVVETTQMVMLLNDYKVKCSDLNSSSCQRQHESVWKCLWYETAERHEPQNFKLLCSKEVQVVRDSDRTFWSVWNVNLMKCKIGS